MNIGRGNVRVGQAVTAVAVVLLMGALTPPTAYGQSPSWDSDISIEYGAVVPESQFFAEVSLNPRGNTWWPVTRSSQEITYRLRNAGSSSVNGKVTVMVDQMFSRQRKVGEERSFTLSPGRELTGFVRSDIAPQLIMRPMISVRTSSGSLRVDTIPDSPQWVVPWGVVLTPMLLVVAGVTGWVAWKRRAVSGV